MISRLEIQVQRVIRWLIKNFDEMLITEIYDMNHGIHRNKFPNVFLVLTSKKIKVILELRNMNLLIMLIIAMEALQPTKMFKTEKYCAGNSSNI